MLLVVLFAAACGRMADDRSSQFSEDDSRFGYRLGKPEFKPTADEGSGVHAAKPWTYAKAAERRAMLEGMPGAALAVGWDAARHLRHYLLNTGEPLSIDLERMVRECSDAKGRYWGSLVKATQFAMSKEPGVYSITSAKMSNGYNYKDDSANWFYAIGGHTLWSGGQIKVLPEAGGRIRYQLRFDYYFFDRYNWNGGAEVQLFGIKITDDSMGEFHKMGLAQEFDVHGKFSRTFEWWDEDDVTQKLLQQWPELQWNDKDQKVLSAPEPERGEDGPDDEGVAV